MTGNPLTTHTPRHAHYPLGAAVVTGGTSGIGLEIVRGLVGAGFGVVATGRGEAPRELIEEFEASVRFVQVDHADPASAAKFAAMLDDRHGPLTALVNNVGRRHGAMIEEFEAESLIETMQLNVVSHLLMTQALVPLMAHEGGAIVNVSSRLASVGMAGVSGYSASKGAVNGFTIAAAIELAPKRIRVNAIAPGMTRTPLIDEWLQEQPDPTAAEEGVAADIPLGRLAAPTDIAGSAVFLASPDASYITGAIVPVDGGYTAA